MWQEGLTNNTLQVFEEISKLECIKDLHLCGGTGISIQLNHRFSEDLDFEVLTYRGNSKELNSAAIIAEVKSKFPDTKIEYKGGIGNQFECVFGEHVKLSFFKPTYKVPELNEVTILNNLKTVSLQDALGMKLYTITQRSKFRDYYDIYSLLKAGYSLEKGIEYATRFSRHDISTRDIIAKLLAKNEFLERENEGAFQTKDLKCKYNVSVDDILECIKYELTNITVSKQKIDKTAFKSVGRAFYETFMSAQGDKLNDIIVSLGKYSKIADEKEKVKFAYSILKTQGAETIPYESLDNDVQEIRMKKDIESLGRVDEIIASHNSYQNLKVELANFEKTYKDLESVEMDETVKKGVLSHYQECIESAKQKIAETKYSVKFKELDDYSTSKEETKTFRVVEVIDNKEHLRFETADKVKAVEFILANYKENNIKETNIDLQYGKKTKWDSKFHSFDKLIKIAIPDALNECKGVVLPNIKDKSVKIIEAEKHTFKVNSDGIVIVRYIDELTDKLNLQCIIPESETNGLGTVHISSTSISKFINESAVKNSIDPHTHYSILYCLKDLIKSSELVEIHSDYNKGEDGVRKVENGYTDKLTILRAYGAVRMSDSDEVLRAKITLKQELGPNTLDKRMYNYEVVSIEFIDKEEKKKLDCSTKLPGTSTQCKRPDNAPILINPISFNRNSNDSITLAKLLNGVVKSYDGGKKVLDESKNSLAEYEKETNLVVKEYIKMNGFLRDRKVEEKCVDAKNLCEMFAKQMSSSTDQMKGIGGIRMVDTDLKIKDDKEETESQNKSKGRRR